MFLPGEESLPPHSNMQIKKNGLASQIPQLCINCPMSIITLPVRKTTFIEQTKPNSHHYCVETVTLSPQLFQQQSCSLCRLVWFWYNQGYWTASVGWCPICGQLCMWLKQRAQYTETSRLVKKQFLPSQLHLAPTLGVVPSDLMDRQTHHDSIVLHG